MKNLHKNRLISVSLIALLLAAMLALPAQAMPTDYAYACVTDGALHLRETASADSADLGHYSSGTWVEVIDTVEDGAWLQVRTMDGHQGYMDAAYLIQDEGGNTHTGATSNDGKFVNLHNRAELDATVIAQVADNTPLTINYHEYGWYNVTVDNQTGFMIDGMVRSSTKPVAYKYVAASNGGNVNLRVGPSESTEALASLHVGTQVEVLITGNGWDKVNADGQLGFVSTHFLADNSNDGGGTPNPQHYTIGYVATNHATSALRLREGPSTAAVILGSYHNGTKVRVYHRGATWAEVTVSGVHGYMLSEFISATQKEYPDEDPGYNSDGFIAAKVHNPNGGDIVNMRSDPSLSADVVMEVPIGSDVEVYSKGPTWCKVRAGGEWGYISTHFLKF